MSSGTCCVQKKFAIDLTKNTAHVSRIKVFVTGTTKRNGMSRSPRAWMSRFAPQHSSAMSQHTCCLCHGSPLVLFPFRLFVNEEAGQALDIANCWPNATFVAGAGGMWHHVIPRGCVGSGAGSSLLCGQSQSTPVHASWIILPCHLYCAQVWVRHTGILTVWGSVGETLGAPDPEEFWRTN